MRASKTLAIAISISAKAIACAPSDLGGIGTRAVTEFNTAGAAAGWWCPNETTPRIYALRWQAVTPDLYRAIDGLRSAADPATTIEQLAANNATTPLADLRDVWGPMSARLMASKQTWVVAQAPSTASPPGTRPAYPWVNGARGSVSNGRATQGSACDPAVGRMEGSTAYYGVNSRSDQVAVCVRRSN